ncbi:pyruvate kinase [Lactococcus sp.]|uniref:pyruvate kinase n=1 Tax=Lactococcus sp. TaxID=44273 RepID=UPI0035AF3C68
MNKRVKIVSTLGPAIEVREGKTFFDKGFWAGDLDVESTAKKIAELIENGANVFRFNFSHGDHEEQGNRMAAVHRAEEIAGRKVGFLLDTKGPEIRTEVFSDTAKADPEFDGEGNLFNYKVGDKLRVATKQGLQSEKDMLALNVAGGLDIFDDVEVGKRILIDDGKLGLLIVGKNTATREFEVEVENDGVIAKQKGVNIPGTKINFPALADRDDADIRFGLSQGINFIAISFVRKAADVLAVRRILEETGHTGVKLYPKIENQQGIDNLDEIIEVADGIMIARGDMGIEVPFEMVPVYQKMIISKVNKAGKTVITATNMLESMTYNPRATRAEISDVFNAVIDGTDATMLSGESANGHYPAESVNTMAKTAMNAQTMLSEYGRLRPDRYDRTSVTEVVAAAVKDAANAMDIKLIIALTESGATARLISKYRPDADILAVTFDEKIERSLTVVWGVIPMLASKPSSTDDMFEVAEKAALKSGLVESGDNIIIVAGVPVGSGRTNTMRIRTVK